MFSTIKNPLTKTSNPLALLVIHVLDPISNINLVFRQRNVYLLTTVIFTRAINVSVLLEKFVSLGHDSFNEEEYSYSTLF